MNHDERAVAIEGHKRHFDDAWPAEAGASHSDLLIYEETSDQVIEVLHPGRGLPAPFHRGLRLSPIVGTRTSARDDAEAVAATILRTADLSKQLLAISDRLHEIARRTGIMAGAAVPTMVVRMVDGRFSVHARTYVSALDDAGNKAVTTHDLTTPNSHTGGWKELLRIANSQAARREISGGRLVADQVTAVALSRMTDRGRRRLLDHLRTHPQADGAAAGAMSPNWTEPSLRPHGIPMPDRMETIHVRDGRIVGRIRLGDATAWNGGKLIHRGEAIPATTLAAIVGEPIGVLVDHADLAGDMTILAARMDGFGALRVDVSCRLGEVI